jgi:hypothetical protein
VRQSLKKVKQQMQRKEKVWGRALKQIILLFIQLELEIIVIKTKYLINFDKNSAK